MATTFAPEVAHPLTDIDPALVRELAQIEQNVLAERYAERREQLGMPTHEQIALAGVRRTNHESLYQVHHEGIHAADTLYDRKDIEAEAWRLMAQRNQMPAVAVKFQEYKNNGRTAIMEALTASGHLSVVELHGTLEEINAQVLRRLLNGWDHSLEPHELARCFAELCNELIIQRVHRAIVAGKLPPDTEVLEKSDYPPMLRGKGLGYRDPNEKGMGRSTGLRHNGGDQYTRVIETVSRSNSTDGSTFKFFRACGSQPRLDKPADLVALESPHIYCRRDYRDGIVDIERWVDWHAGRGVLFGDTGERTAKHPIYENLRAESERREKQVDCFVGRLAELEQQLDQMFAEGKVTKADRAEIYGEEVMRVLDAICTLDPSYAEDTFGKASAVVFKQAAWLTVHGRHAEAAMLLQNNNFLKQTVTFCGMEISIAEAQAKGLKVNSYGELVSAGEESYGFDDDGFCIVCQAPPTAEEIKANATKKCGPCGICRPCDTKIRKKTKRSSLALAA